MADNRINEYVRDSQFVIAGRVEKTGATTMSIVPAAPNTGVFKIDQILHGPSVLSGFAGKEITVIFQESGTVNAGESAVIFATSWLYGESLAVIEVGRTELREIMRDEINDAYRRLDDERLLERIVAAELVIAGKVVKSEPAPEEIQRRMPITEHTPLWWVAEIQVAAVLKGHHESKRIIIVFPSSTDVTWHDAPKFKTGDAGIWILQRNQQERGWPMMRVEGLTALHPLDFQPPERRSHVQALIRRGSGKERKG
ncbi:MAG TPA: hypothetical protein VI685_29725 [Candidatus Angelobacter sp.]